MVYKRKMNRINFHCHRLDSVFKIIRINRVYNQYHINYQNRSLSTFFNNEAFFASRTKPIDTSTSTSSSTSSSSSASFIVICDGNPRPPIPRHLLDVSFSRSSGAGGQNVNKVNTKAEVRFHLEKSLWLSISVKERFKVLYSQFINDAGEVIISSQRHRTQERNLDDCIEKLQICVRKAAEVPKQRSMRTALSELTKNERRDDKRFRSTVKERRRSSREGGEYHDD